MAEQWSLQVTSRKPGHPRRDRASGGVPAVVYGHGVASQSVKVAERELQDLLDRGGAHHLVSLSVEGETAARTVVVKEVQHHPVTRRVRHVDFQAVSARERIHAEVPIRVVGEDAVSRSGGVVQVTLHAVRITCLPSDLPDHVEGDVARLAIGQSLTVAGLAIPSGVHVENDPDDLVAHVVAPRASEAAPQAPADASSKAEA